MKPDLIYLKDWYYIRLNYQCLYKIYIYHISVTFFNTPLNSLRACSLYNSRPSAWSFTCFKVYCKYISSIDFPWYSLVTLKCFNNFYMFWNWWLAVINLHFYFINLLSKYTWLEIQPSIYDLLYCFGVTNDLAISDRSYQ